MAKALGTSVTLAFGFEPPAFYAGEPTGQRDAIEAIGTKTLRGGAGRGQVHRSLGRGRGPRRWPVARPPSLIAMAERDHARMIVVGHHGGGTVRGAIMGSVTFKVLHDAPCPVLVVSAEG